jgi:hypothetical protein
MGNTYKQARTVMRTTQDELDWLIQATTSLRRVIDPTCGTANAEDQALASFILGEQADLEVEDYLGVEVYSDELEGEEDAFHVTMGGMDQVNLPLMVLVLQAFLRHFEKDSTISMTWASVGDNLFDEEVDSGGCVITREDVWMLRTSDWLEHVNKRLNKKTIPSFGEVYGNLS